MPTAVTSLELYQQALSTPSDIWEHLPTLHRLAEGCEHVTEFGTRRGCSTRAFLHAQPQVLVSYGLVREPDVDLLEEAARQAGRPRFRFVQADVLQVEIEETDLLFVDTFHVYEQTRRELALHAARARKYLVFHDTTTFAESGEGEGSRGIWPAIEEFLRDHPDWRLQVRLTNNNGLTILERQAVAAPVMRLPQGEATPLGREKRSDAADRWIARLAPYLQPLRQRPVVLLQLGVTEETAPRLWRRLLPAATICVLDRSLLSGLAYSPTSSEA
jgi:hypothetical protein